MQNWTALFSSYTHSGVYPAGREKASGLKTAAAACNLAVIVVKLRRAADKEGLLAALARDMDFPQYFGRNWDALHDCLTDLSWKPAQGYVIYFEGFGAFEKTDPADARTARQIFDSCADFWKQKAVPFFMVV